MAELPSDTIYNIFSRIPIKDLARFRCVCKLWRNYINDPYLDIIHNVKQETTFLMFHHLPPTSNLPCTLTFAHINESKEHPSAVMMKRNTMKLQNLKSFSYSIRGSCKELLLASQTNKCNSLIVIHPIRKDCYELPPNSGWLCSIGLGFDDSTFTYKTICVLIKELNQCTMVHVLGTDSWREIPQVPRYPMMGEGVFSHGCLHWLTTRGTKVIYFDVKKEVFGLLDPPKQVGWIDDNLVDLEGEVGYVYNENFKLEVWILKQKTWMLYCQLDKNMHISNINMEEFDYWYRPQCGGYIEVIGCWNKDGDILMATHRRRWLFVYRLKSGVLHFVKGGVVADEGETSIRTYRSKLFLQLISSISQDERVKYPNLKRF